MKNKNNIFLMLLAIATLLTAVVGATYAYFASVTDGTGVSTDLDVEAQANTAQFTAEGGTFGFTVTGADMMQANAGSLAKESTGSLEVNLTSPKLALCTFDVKFVWNEGSSYTPTATLVDGVTEFGVLYEGNSYGAVNNAAKVINFDKLLNNYNGIVLDQAKIAILESDGTEKTETINLNFKVQMYNLNHDQSALTGGSSKSYNGKFYIDNVECTETKLPLNDVILASNEIYPDNIPSPTVTYSDKISFAQNSSNVFDPGYSGDNGRGLFYTSTNTEGNLPTFYFRDDSPYVSFATNTLESGTCTYNGEDVYYASNLSDITGNVENKATTRTECTSSNICDMADDGVHLFYIVGLNEATCTSDIPEYFGTGETGVYLNEQATFTTTAVEQEEILWRIIRINEDRSIRLIKVDDIGSYTPSGLRFTNGSGLLADYYVNNLLEYEEFIADTGFCNDLSTNDDPYASNRTYAAVNRLGTLYQPQFKCPNSDDVLTVANGKLKYPIGFITADEAVYAGSSTTYASPSSFYLSPYSNGGDYGIWTMTPAFYEEGYNIGSYFIDSYGIMSSNYGFYVDNPISKTFPVINLKSDVKYLSGTGTQTNPYKIIMSQN